MQSRTSRPIFDPGELGIDLSDPAKVRIWRGSLRRYLWVTRPRICEGCQRKLIREFDVHEGIVTRGDVRGWSFEDRGLIFSEYNTTLLHHLCHLMNPPTRQYVWDIQVARYGEEKMRGWYEGLPFKIGAPQKFWT